MAVVLNYLWMLFHLWNGLDHTGEWDICGIICVTTTAQKVLGLGLTQPNQDLKSWYRINESTIVTEYNGPLEAVHRYTHSVGYNEEWRGRVYEADWGRVVIIYSHALLCSFVRVVLLWREEALVLQASKRWNSYLRSSPVLILCETIKLCTRFMPRRCAYI